MPQARLPDINAAFTKHRTEAMSALKSRNYDSVFGSLNALNGLLPDTEDDEGNLKYRVLVSDIEYANRTKHTIYAKCNHCDEQIDYSTFTVFPLVSTTLDAAISGKKKESVWICPKCEKINNIEKTSMSETTLAEPYFLGVVPKAPSRKQGLMDRTKYHNKIVQWALTFLGELEARMAQFRDDNWTKTSEFGAGDEEEFDTSDDEKA